MITLDVSYNAKDKYYTLVATTTDTSATSQMKMDAILQCLADSRAPRRGGFIPSDKGLKVVIDVANVETLQDEQDPQKAENEV